MFNVARGVAADGIRMVAARPGRTASAGFGVALGSALFVLAVGIGEAAQAQVSERFDVTRATTIVADVSPGTAVDLALARSIDGVEAVSAFSVFPRVRVSVAGQDSKPSAEPLMDVVAADSAFVGVIEPTVNGTALRTIDHQTQLRVAMVGRQAADRLDLAVGRSVLRIAGERYAVIGIVEDVDRFPEALLGVVIPASVADRIRDRTTNESDAVMAVARPGAAQVVAKQMAVALSPAAPHSVKVSSPVDPQDLRVSVSSDVRRLSFGAAAVALIGGIVAVANLMVLGVMQRFREFGLRRAVGALRRHIVSQVLIEASLVGSAAGIVGCVVGVWGLLGVCIFQGWSPVLDLDVIVLGVASGTVAGILGGVSPALVAARIEPSAALRSQ